MKKIKKEPKKVHKTLWIEVRKKNYRGLPYFAHRTLKDAKFSNEGDEDVYDIVEYVPKENK